MSQLSDYLGRTVDLVAFGGVTATGEQQLALELAGPGESGMVCAGPQKVVQRFCLRFLKEQGSEFFRPEDGTEFMLKLNRGELRNQVDAFVAFSEAQLVIRRQLQAEETDADPADERYDRATLASLAVLPGLIKLYINIATLAGETRPVILPIPITVR